MTLARDHLPADGPAVVLLHAGVADRRAWRAVAPVLHAAGLDVLAYDRRGFGETPPQTGTFRHLDDLLGLLERPAWLVGNSMGGGLALDAALEAPELVAGLVLIGTAVSGQPWDADGEEEPEPDDLEERNRQEIQYWLDGPTSPEGRVDGAARELALDMNRIALGSGMPEDAGASGVDAWARLEEVAVPVTVVWGALDEPGAAETGAALGERLPDVRGLIEMPGVAHLPSLEQPDEVARIVLEAVR